MKRSHEASSRVLMFHFSDPRQTSVNKNSMENCRTQNLCADWEDKLKKLRLDDSGPRPGQRTKRNRDATVPISRAKCFFLLHLMCDSNM